MVVHLPEALEIAVQDVDIGVHSHGQGGRGHPGDSGTQNDHFGAPHTGNPADEHSSAAGRAHQMVCPHERGHATGYLAHGREEGERAVRQLHGLVGDGRRARRQQGVGALARGGQVEVGEQDEVPTEAVELLGQGLFDLADQVRSGPDVVSGVENGGSHRGELPIGNRRPQPGALLDEDSVALR